MRGLSWIAGVTAVTAFTGYCQGDHQVSRDPAASSVPSDSPADSLALTARPRSRSRGLPMPVRLTTAPGMHARSECLKSDVTAAEFRYRFSIPEAFQADQRL